MASATPLALSLCAGIAVGALAMYGYAHATRPPPRPAAAVACPPADDDNDEELLAANASLARQLQACNRKLSDLTPAASARPQPPPPAPSAWSRQGRGDRRRAPLTAEDWERHAEAGTVPYRIPCLRDTPFTPTERDIERLGLSPDDVTAINEAYAASNRRMTEQILPACSNALGSSEAATKIGPSACLKVVTEAARRGDPEKMKASLTRVAEQNAGKAAPGEATPLEAMLRAMTAEGRRFEQDLAAKLGPEAAARIATSRGLCSEQGTVSAAEGARQGRARRAD